MEKASSRSKRCSKATSNRSRSDGKHALAEIIAATHAGMTSDEFREIATDWIATAKHPRFNRLYTECVYQPQLELLAYLRHQRF